MESLSKQLAPRHADSQSFDLLIDGSAMGRKAGRCARSPAGQVRGPDNLGQLASAAPPEAAHAAQMGPKLAGARVRMDAVHWHVARATSS